MKNIYSPFIVAATFVLLSLPSNLFAQQWQSYYAPEMNTQVLEDGVWLGIVDGCFMVPCYAVELFTSYGHSPHFLGGNLDYDFKDASTGIIDGQYFQVTNDTGNTWTPVGSNTFTISNFPLTQRNINYIHDSLSYLFGRTYPNAGASFARIIKDTTIVTTYWDSLQPPSESRSLLHFVNDSIGFIILKDVLGLNSYVLKTSNYGSSWSAIMTDSVNQFSTIIFRDSLNGTITASNQIYETNDAGLTWSILPSPTFPIGKFSSSAFFNDSIGYLTSDSGYVLRTNDRGISWNIELDSTNATYHIPINVSVNKIIDKDIAYFNYNLGKLFRRSKLPTTLTETQKENDLELIIYPNPAANKIVVEVEDEHLNPEFIIYDMSGRLVLRSSETNIDVAHLGSGTYFIQAINGEKSYHGKFLKVD